MEKEHSRQKKEHVQIFRGLIYWRSAKKFSVTGPWEWKGEQLEMRSGRQNNQGQSRTLEASVRILNCMPVFEEAIGEFGAMNWNVPIKLLEASLLLLHRDLATARWVERPGRAVVVFHMEHDGWCHGPRGHGGGRRKTWLSGLGVVLLIDTECRRKQELRMTSRLSTYHWQWIKTQKAVWKQDARCYVHQWMLSNCRINERLNEWMNKSCGWLSDLPKL